MMSKKQIGLLVGDSGSYRINSAYINFVDNAGYEPFIITPKNDINTIRKLNGLIFIGGEDVNPTLYGYSNHDSKGVNTNRDKWEQWLFRELKNVIPIFGICRGFQLIGLEYLNEAELANLDEPLIFRQHIHSHQQGENNIDRGDAFHYIYCDRELYAKDIKDVFVNSMHHQGIMWQIKDKRLLPPLGDIKPLAWTTHAAIKNHVVLEAFSWGNMVRAVQFHPEEMNDIELLKVFFK